MHATFMPTSCRPQLRARRALRLARLLQLHVTLPQPPTGLLQPHACHSCYSSKRAGCSRSHACYSHMPAIPVTAASMPAVAALMPATVLCMHAAAAHIPVVFRAQRLPPRACNVFDA